jgi:hypothetical protein
MSNRPCRIRHHAARQAHAGAILEIAPQSDNFSASQDEGIWLVRKEKHLILSHGPSLGAGKRLSR